MNNKEIKLKTKRFIKEFEVREISYARLKQIVESQGYTVIEYNHILNDEDTNALIDALKLSDRILRSRGFTYADHNYRIVFVHEDLTDGEKTVVLAHEEGHIFLGHMSTAPIIGKDVQEEYEANEFVHFLLNQNAIQYPFWLIRKHKTLAIIVSVAILLLASGLFIFSKAQHEKQFYGDYYITESGNKYHEKNCIFVKDKTNIHRMTVEEFESGKYEPCGICLP